jgi:hypothetical protein
LAGFQIKTRAMGRTGNLMTDHSAAFQRKSQVCTRVNHRNNIAVDANAEYLSARNFENTPSTVRDIAKRADVDKLIVRQVESPSRYEREGYHDDGLTSLA